MIPLRRVSRDIGIVANKGRGNIYRYANFILGDITFGIE